MPTGVFLSLDGIDGTGKSTQCRLLAEALRKERHDVLICSDPGGTTVGNELRELLLHRRHDINPMCEALLFMASRAQLLAEIVRPALAEGRVVISDRYLLANVVYQGHAGGLDPAMLWQIGSLATESLQPDLTLILDLPLEKAIARRRRPADRMEQRPPEYHQRVRDGFLTEAKRNSTSIHVIDASPSAHKVHLQILQEVRTFLESTDSEQGGSS